MCLVKIGSVLSLGTVVAISNFNSIITVTLDYYGKKHKYTTEEIEGML